MTSSSRALFAAVALCAAAAPVSALAEEGPEPQAIQERKFQLFHEFRFAAGSMPLDPYQKGWTLSLSYTTHFDEVWSWEVVQLTGALLSSTNLRESLIDQFAVPPEDFSAPRLALTTGIEISPFYGKQALMNDRIVHQALLGGIYAGVVFGDRPSFGDILGDVRPAVGFGLGYRLYGDALLSFRFDARNLVTFRRAIRANEDFKVENVLLLTLSVSFNLWRDDA